MVRIKIDLTLAFRKDGRIARTAQEAGRSMLDGFQTFGTLARPWFLAKIGLRFREG